MLCAGDEVLGCFGAKAMEFVQAMHHLLVGRYVVYMKGRASKRPDVPPFPRRPGRAARTAPIPA